MHENELYINSTNLIYDIENKLKKPLDMMWCWLLSGTFKNLAPTQQHTLLA